MYNSISQFRTDKPKPKATPLRDHVSLQGKDSQYFAEKVVSGGFVEKLKAKQHQLTTASRSQSSFYIIGLKKKKTKEEKNERKKNKRKALLQYKIIIIFFPIVTNTFDDCGLSQIYGIELENYQQQLLPINDAHQYNLNNNNSSMAQGSSSLRYAPRPITDEVSLNEILTYEEQIQHQPKPLIGIFVRDVTNRNSTKKRPSGVIGGCVLKIQPPW